VRAKGAASWRWPSYNHDRAMSTLSWENAACPAYKPRGHARSYVFYCVRCQHAETIKQEPSAAVSCQDKVI
jgi:hypothetical protein